jgi:signal transduction histidine kinase
MSGGIKTSKKFSLLAAFKRLFTPRLSTRVLLYFFAMSLIPVVVVSSLLVNSARERLVFDTGKRQQNIAKDYANRVDSFVESNLEQLSFVARLYSQGTINYPNFEKQLSELMLQNQSLERIRIILTDGREVYLEQKQGNITSLPVAQPTGNTTAANLFATRKVAFILNVGKRVDEDRPQLNIGVPILASYQIPSTDGLQRFQSASESNILGALQGFYDLTTLWENFLEDSKDENSNRSAYVVDNFGNLASHSNTDFLKSSNAPLSNIAAVEQIKSNDLSTKQTLSEESIEVLSSPVRLKYGDGWGVVVQEPIDSIYAGIEGYIQSATLVLVSSIILAVTVSVYFARQITIPLRKLAQGAKKIESGDFNSPIVINTHDEFEELAGSFNSMSSGIKSLIQDMQANNMRLIIEKAKLNNIISSVSDGIIAVNRLGKIVSANPQASQLVTLLPSDLKGKAATDTFKWEKDGAILIPDLTKPGVYKYDDLVLRGNDNIYYLDLMVAILERNATESDDDVAAIITVRDQTATRELSFMKLDFVAIAAHELRTPLTVVRGYLDILNTSAMKQMSVYNLENLQKAIVGANQLRELINKLLNIARIERGDMEIFVEKLDIRKLVADNVEQHVSVASQKHQSILFSSSNEGVVYVPADPASIVEVMNNLLGNALKYTERGGTIKVELVTDDRFATVKVIDDGPGIPNELRTKLFTKFYRAERSMISGSRGTGLGLFISKTIIELQSGTIGILPDEGKGSTFFFTLPIYNASRDDELITKKTSGGIHGWFKKRTNH